MPRPEGGEAGSNLGPSATAGAPGPAASLVGGGLGALGFAFRPLWRLGEPAPAVLALSRAQAAQVYAGFRLWPAGVMAGLTAARPMGHATDPGAAVSVERPG